MSKTEIVVAIPTFRRPLGLERCLRALAAMPEGERFRIVVSDNDVEGQQGIGVCQRLVREGFPIAVEAVVSRERGLASNRNRLIETALKDDSVLFVAMIDDDEWPDDVWLSELMRVQRDTGADIVGGPVKRIFEISVPEYIRHVWGGRPEQQVVSGPIDFVHATSNVLFKAHLFRGAEPLLFDSKFGFMGGEDKDLMLRLKIKGRTFGWAHRAIVTEEMPASRCSLKWVVARAYRVGNTDMAVTLKNRAPGFSYVGEIVTTAGGGAVGLIEMVVFFWHRQRRFEGLLKVARASGKISGLFGSQYQEYRVVHGK